MRFYEKDLPAYDKRDIKSRYSIDILMLMAKNYTLRMSVIIRENITKNVKLSLVFFALDVDFNLNRGSLLPEKLRQSARPLRL